MTCTVRLAVELSRASATPVFVPPAALDVNGPPRIEGEWRLAPTMTSGDSRSCWLSWKARNTYVTLLLIMKGKAAKTSFDRYFSERMKDPAFSAAYTEARAGIDSVDAFMRSLELVRERAAVTKAELAKRTGTRPEAVRRLLTSKDVNPTLATVMSIARSLGYSLALVPAQQRPGKHRKAA